VCYTDDTRYLQVLQTDNKFMGPMRHASEHFILREKCAVVVVVVYTRFMSLNLQR